MSNDLNDLLNQIGICAIASEKAEIEFTGDHGSDSFWVSVKYHLPDGTYTDAELFKYTLDEN